MLVDIQPSTCRLSNFLLSASRWRSIPLLSRISATVPNMAITVLNLPVLNQSLILEPRGRKTSLRNDVGRSPPVLASDLVLSEKRSGRQRAPNVARPTRSGDYRCDQVLLDEKLLI